MAKKNDSRAEARYALHVRICDDVSVLARIDRETMAHGLAVEVE
jgi:hypothetical protein